MIIEQAKEAKDILEDTLAVTQAWDQVRIDLIQKLLQDLKAKIVHSGFTDTREEIYFFKIYKPYFSSQLMFAYAIQKFRMDHPAWSAVFLRQYYQAKLKEIHVYFEAHKEMVSYYRSGANHLDEALFLRGGSSCPSWLCTWRIDADERFSTLGDYPFSKIKAHELTAQYIEHVLEAPSEAPVADPATPRLNWTGDTINFIELAYGIHCTGQISHGQAGIMDIIRALADSFNVDIKRPYRRFSEIKQCKRLSRTQYIDRMASALKQKLEDEEAYVI